MKKFYNLGVRTKPGENMYRFFFESVYKMGFDLMTRRNIPSGDFLFIAKLRNLIKLMSIFMDNHYEKSVTH